jgi:hypothetical protein
LCAVAPALVILADRLNTESLWGLLVEAVSLLALLSAVALTLQRRWRVLEPAQFAVFAVLLIAVFEQVTAGRWVLLASPGPAWTDAHRRWAVIAVLALLVCLWQLRDPAAHRGRFPV